ncbi:MAG: hypothetical protein JW757_04815 [Anaerolineales bacterium]|nr:hypothetical protein [Anaerolineales bacterium]
MKALFARILKLVLFFTLAFILTACGTSNTPTWDNLPPGTYAPHPVFEEFYLQHGGHNLFGYPVSTVFTDQAGTRYQYFETVLMSFNPANGAISFEPLGLQLGLDTLPVLAWQGPDKHGDDGLTVGEFKIHPAFVPLYLSLGPERVGLPITDPFYNPGRNRMEQHFEGTGMFFLLNDPEETPLLLDYSLVACQSCRPQSHPRQTIAIIQTLLPDDKIYEQMKWANIPISLTGEMIKGPALLVDGTIDFVFEHLALYHQDGALKIRPVPVLLGLKDEFYYAHISHPDLVFYEINEGAGHNIYRPFDTFIWENGGYQVSGEPISEIIPLNRELGQIQQCFRNYCLEYIPQNVGTEIRPVPLGQFYLESHIPIYVPTKESEDSGKNDNQNERSVTPFTLIVWEHPTVVDSQTPETISVKVILENTPQPGLTVTLKVILPDGTEAFYQMPPTGEDGTTSYTLNPIQAENSQLVFYETCLVVQGKTQLCVDQSFMIWGNP